MPRNTEGLKPQQGQAWDWGSDPACVPGHSSTVAAAQGSWGEFRAHLALPPAELHLELDSVILIFSTLGINRACAATIAFLMHHYSQTLRVGMGWGGVSAW